LNGGDIVAATTSYDRSLELDRQVLGVEPDNAEFQETFVRGAFAQAQILILQGKMRRAGTYLDEGAQRLSSMIASDRKNMIWVGELRWIEAITRTRLALALGQMEEARTQMGMTLALLAKHAEKGDAAWASMAHTLAGDIASRSGDSARARSEWKKAYELARSQSGTGHELFVALKRLGRLKEAAAASAELDRRGYRHPAYLREKI